MTQIRIFALGANFGVLHWQKTERLINVLRKCKETDAQANVIHWTFNSVIVQYLLDSVFAKLCVCLYVWLYVCLCEYVCVCLPPPELLVLNIGLTLSSSMFGRHSASSLGWLFLDLPFSCCLLRRSGDSSFGWSFNILLSWLTCGILISHFILVWHYRRKPTFLCICLCLYRWGTMITYSWPSG